MNLQRRVGKSVHADVDAEEHRLEVAPAARVRLGVRNRYFRRPSIVHESWASLRLVAAAQILVLTQAAAVGLMSVPRPHPPRAARDICGPYTLARHPGSCTRRLRWTLAQRIERLGPPWTCARPYQGDDVAACAYRLNSVCPAQYASSASWSSSACLFAYPHFSYGRPAFRPYPDSWRPTSA